MTDLNTHTTVEFPNKDVSCLLTHVYQVAVPDFLKGFTKDCEFVAKDFASLLHYVILDSEGADALKEANKRRLKPDFINSMKNSDIHQFACDAYVSDIIDEMKKGIVDKINDLKVELPYVSAKLLKEVEQEHKDGLLLRAEDELAALGNKMLAAACLAHDFDPQFGSRFLFHREVGPEEDNKAGNKKNEKAGNKKRKC